MNISKRQKLALGILAAIAIATPAIAYAASTYFVVTATVSIHDPPVMTVQSIASSFGTISCTGLPASGDGSSPVSLSCALSVTKGTSGTITVTVSDTFAQMVSVSAAGSASDFAISNPSAQSAGTGGTAFAIGLSVLPTAPDASTPLTITIQA